ncbi:MAG: T9SS type A sorting domain-containing protein, partial [Bacteroidota bacterium]
PPDRTVDCSYNVMPELHLFEAEADCNLNLSFSVSEVQLNGTSNCPNSTLQYVYTAMDACGRIAQHTQTYTIQNEGPEFVCPVDICVIDCPADNEMIQTTFDNYANLATVNTSCAGDIVVTNDFSPSNFINQNCNNGPVAIDNTVAYQTVTFTATDQCGRTSTCTALVVIQDTTAPGISGETYDAIRYNNALVQSEYEAWANDNLANLSADDDCNGFVGDLEWSFSPASPNTVMSGPFATTIVSFTATDGCGNEASVTATFRLKEEPTSSSNIVSGSIANEENEAIENVAVSLSMNSAGELSSYMTSSDGYFEFAAESDQNYEVTPNREDNPLNGVSTMDLILISKHMLGIEFLDSPYKIIAADANNSGTITAADLLEIRKLILFITDDFENNTSWRFVDANYVFPNPINPFDFTFPSTYSINGLSVSEIANFIAIKIGDVNGNASTNALSANGETRSNQSLTFQLDEQLLKSGQSYRVDFKAKDFKNILGYQFSLNFDPALVDFIDFLPGQVPGLSSANFGTSHLNEGVLTSSWNQQTALNLADETVLFSLEFEAKATVALSEVIELGSPYTSSEAYNDQTDLLNVNLDFGQTTVGTSPSFALDQNQPNPFKDQTTIGFHLPEATTATLTIYDVSGRVLLQQKGDYSAGYHQMAIDQANLKQSGLMYYTLKTATDSATKKMIVLDR